MQTTQESASPKPTHQENPKRLNGTISSFNMFSLPPIPSPQYNSSPPQHEMDQHVDQQPLSMQEFLNLSNAQRFQYQNYLNHNLQRQRDEEYLQHLKEQNEKVKATLMKDRSHWIDDAALYCSRQCLGRQSTLSNLWSEWLSHEANPLRCWDAHTGRSSSESDSISFRMWSKEKLLHSFYSLFGQVSDPSSHSFKNETSSSSEIYDRIFHHEEQCIKQCIKKLHKSQEVLNRKWSDLGGWDKMHLNVLEESAQKAAASQHRAMEGRKSMFGGIMGSGSSNGGLLSSIVEGPKSEEQQSQLGASSLDAAKS